jgi:SAM-dependent methyltransferase
LAARYDELRPDDANWWELLERVVQEGDLRGRRVLDVGCGTGRQAAALAERYTAKVWGIDPSREMLAKARERAPRGVGIKLARAEQLPFSAGWFERALMWLSVHLVDRPRAFTEIQRVLRPTGRLVIATFDPRYFDGFWLPRFFPSVATIDRARFPDREALERELRQAGFEPRLERVSQSGSVDREAALRKIRGRHISTLRLIGEDEYRAGLDRAERELPARIDYAIEWLVAVGDR